MHCPPPSVNDWTVRALHLMQGSNARLVSSMPKVFAEAGRLDELRAALERSLREHSATSEIAVLALQKPGGLAGADPSRAAQRHPLRLRTRPA